MTKRKFRYDCWYGYIRGELLDNEGFTWIDKFVIYPRYRGKGYARKLAEKLPRKARLFAHRLYDTKKTGKELTSTQLVEFYKSLGFTHRIDKFGNNFMERNE